MNRKNILIVDDEKDILLVLEKGLTAEGYSVTTRVYYQNKTRGSIWIKRY